MRPTKDDIDTRDDVYRRSVRDGQWLDEFTTIIRPERIMDKPVMMKCGHTAMAQDSEGNPVCATCIGLSPDAKIVDNSPPDLTGRVAKCSCGNTQESAFSLPFFEYRGSGSTVAKEKCHVCGFHTKGMNHFVNGVLCYNNSNRPIPSVCINNGKECQYGPFDYDLFYCGCRGWD